MAAPEHEYETFESADSGASLTYPMAAGSVRKNAFLVIKGFPCKVVDVSTSKTGKHGHAKCNFTAVDIFTGKKYEDMTPSSHNVDVPHVTRKEYAVLDLNDEGFLTLMQEDGSTREDLALPSGTEEADKLAQTIKNYLEGEDEISVTVVRAMNTEMVSSVKVINQAVA